MKLKLIFPPPFATTTHRILFLVPRDATTVKGTADAVVKKFCGAPWLSSPIQTDNIELWTEDGFLISPGDSSVIFDAPRGETMVVRVLPVTSTTRRRRSVKATTKATRILVPSISLILACHACKAEKDRKGYFARRQRNRDKPVCLLCTRATMTVGSGPFTDLSSVD
jgi:hypothetical protein